MKKSFSLEICMPFMASNYGQLEAAADLKVNAVEGVIFDRKDLDIEMWNTVWRNIKIATQKFGNKNVVFHFPVNNCNFVEDGFVKNRLLEALNRCSDLGMAGVVVHSNQVYPFEYWKKNSIEDSRKKVVDTLCSVLSSSSSVNSCWLGLENMPVMDNFCREIDPTFIYASDFLSLKGTDIKITWDICHHLNTLANIQQVLENQQSIEWYPNFQETDIFDFLKIESIIAHWHFSAFEGIANPDKETFCKEGVSPQVSSLGTTPYKKILRKICKDSRQSRFMTIEVQEDDYCQRENFKSTARWVKNTLEEVSEK